MALQGTAERAGRAAFHVAGRLGRLRNVLPALLHRAIDLVSAWRRDVAERRCLAGLRDYYLKDIGLSRDDVAPDSRPPFRSW